MTLSIGFSLIELAITLILVSVLTLAFLDVRTLSSRALQSSNATDEFNQAAGLLLTLLNVNGSGSANRCTAAFQGMPIDPVSLLPVISSSGAALPPPSPLAAFITYINLPSQLPIALYRSSGLLCRVWSSKSPPLLRLMQTHLFQLLRIIFG